MNKDGEIPADQKESHLHVGLIKGKEKRNEIAKDHVPFVISEVVF